MQHSYDITVYISDLDSLDACPFFAFSACVAYIHTTKDYIVGVAVNLQPVL